MTIARNIRKFREQYGLTQQELGQIAGVSGKAVSAWELGQKTPRIGALSRIAEFFGLKKSDLLEEEADSSSGELSGEERIFLNLIEEMTAEERKQILALMRLLKRNRR